MSCLRSYDFINGAAATAERPPCGAGEAVEARPHQLELLRPSPEALALLERHQRMLMSLPRRSAATRRRLPR